ncbi:glycosyltransferase family 2 protein [Arthrobacter castelli]|uniref:glycosyltransferase family 2 protein n=1 Tax=Arthrobacter castelli TaxID=271431 RepID=UPI0004239E7F|nr:glycosyltransferase [Arthrobacter castelli]
MTPPASGHRPSFGVVVLTQGTRPGDLHRGLASLQQQTGVDLDVIVVGNGWRPEGLPAGTGSHYIEENVGIPAGRNAGVPLVDGEYLFFLDDDAWLPDSDFLANGAALLAAEPGIGMIQPRIEDPADPASPTRWIPRLRKGSPFHSSNIFSVVEMAVLMRRGVFDATGGWPAPFWYAHEGIEFAWRVWDTGFRVWYAGDLRAAHPVIDPARHEEYFRLNARNRVWLARRNLPWPFSWLYVTTWMLVQVVRWRSHPERLKSWFGGFRAGWRQHPWVPGERRRRIRWQTVLAMARSGRPPVV